MKEKIFNIALNITKKQKKIIYSAMTTASIIGIILLYIFSSSEKVLDIKQMILTIVVTLPIMNTVMLVTFKVTFEKINQLQLIIGENDIKRISEKDSEEIIYEDIIDLQVKYNTNGKLYYMKIKTKTKNINISGFEDMNQIFKLISENIVDKSIISEKQWKINWDKQYIVVLTMILTMSVILLIIKLNIYDIFSIIFMLVLSISYFIHKPLSKTMGKQFRKFEIIAAIITFLSGIFTLIGYIVK